MYTTLLQLRFASGFRVSDQTLCKAKILCDEALDALGEKMRGECLGGFRHSLWVYSDGLPGGRGGFLDKAIYHQENNCSTSDYRHGHSAGKINF